ncbi:guanylate-binding protein 2-like [Eleutherodactylus coqui]|uniref:guanylate-binding protein 2-like n=1 Tax=Eleutherodactylus coqui TaxID=57060 RepID=UPI0034627DB8
MAPIPKISKPICLIENPGDKKLSVNEEAKKILENISQPLVVVSIVGPYRSGKSYLLNKLSGNSAGGFSLGHTLSANTKGIWMWCAPHPKKSDHTLILLDTEGVGDVEKADQENDCIILSLAMLMSSAVIYNTKATIDQDAVKKLHSMTTTHQYITEKASQADGPDVQTADGDHTLPLLVWTLRDATLKLELNGRPVSADEYLENCLQDITPVKSPRTQSQNKARKTIRKFFPKRKCFVFDIPSSDKETLSRMDQVSETKLQAGFTEETKHFCQFVLEEVPPKRLKGGMTVTGSRFAHLLQSYLDVVRRQDIGVLEDSLSNMFTSENNKGIKRSLEGYENKMSSQHVNSLQEFQQNHEAAMKEAKQEFNKSYVTHEKNREEYLDELKAILLTKKDEIWKMCEDSSIQRCNDIKAQLESRIQQSLNENKYHVPGGHKTFTNDKESAIQEYNQKPDKGVKAEDVLQDFLSSLEAMEKVILKTHQDLPDAAPKIFQVPDPNDSTQLTKYIQNYQLPHGPFSRILIQLFGFAGHGKSSFANSCLFTLSNGRFNDYAGEATSQGGKTMDRRAYKLTNCISIVDNRGFSKMNSAEEWEIYAQLCHFVPLNEIVSWNKNLDDRINLITQSALEPSDVIVPVLIYSSENSFAGNESDNIKEFLKQAQKLTGILPFIVLTKSKKAPRSTLKNTFSRMGMENVYCIENYILSDQLAQRRKHVNLLQVLYDILQCVNYHMKARSDFQNRRNDWLRFLMTKAGTILKT